MIKIECVGKHFGVNLSICCVKDEEELFFFFNNREDEFLETEFRNILKLRHSIAGTFFPEENSMMNVLNVIQYYFFDSTPEITIEGDIGELPFEENKIY